MASSPVVVNSNIDQLSKAKFSIPILTLLQKALPRGKAAIPRYIGKILGSPLSKYMITRHGARLVLCPSSYDVYATMRRGGNAWDYHDFEICRAGLPDGGIFYEIGANVGYFAVEQAGLDPSGKVYAFEPQSGLAHAIAASARSNGFSNLSVFHVLVGDRTGTATLYLAPGTIHASAVPDSGRPVRDMQEMAMVALDDLVASGRIAAPDMVKMDVEGSEALVFQGAGTCLRAAKPNIFLEYMAEFDVAGRIRHEIEKLVRDVPQYRLLASPRKNSPKQHGHALFAMMHEGDWDEADGIYLLNTERPVRDAAFFPPQVKDKRPGPPRR